MWLWFWILTKNFSGSTNLAKKRHGSADLHTPIHPPPMGCHIRSPEVNMRKRVTRQLRLVVLNNVLGIATSRPISSCFLYLPSWRWSFHKSGPSCNLVTYNDLFQYAGPNTKQWSSLRMALAMPAWATGKYTKKWKVSKVFRLESRASIHWWTLSVMLSTGKIQTNWHQIPQGWIFSCADITYFQVL